MRALISWAVYDLSSIFFDQSVPIWRLTERTVRSMLVTACRLAISPTRTSPLLVNATTDGVVRPPSAFAMIVGSPPSRTATAELVVPRSIPTARAILCLLYDELPASAARPCESVGVVLWVVLWCFGAQSARHRPELSSRRYANLRLLDSTSIRRQLFPGVVPGEPALALQYPAQYLAAHGTRRAQAAQCAPSGSRAGDRGGSHAHRRLADTGSGLGCGCDSAVELWAMAPVREAAGHPDRPRGARYGAAAGRRGHGATVGAHDPRPALHPHWAGRDGRLPAQPGPWPSGPRTPQGHLAPGPTGSFVGATGGRAPAVCRPQPPPAPASGSRRSAREQARPRFCDEPAPWLIADSLMLALGVAVAGIPLVLSRL